MDTKKETLAIKNRIIGVLLRRARREMGKSIEDCARVLSCAAETISAYELGKTRISLPELELLAAYLRKPLNYFWAEEPSRTAKPRGGNEAINIRNRIIGVQLRQARQRADKTLQDCAAVLEHTSDRIEQYEFGHTSISAAELETLSDFLNVPVTNFFVEEPRPSSAPLAAPSELPADVRDFVSNPDNLPYLKLAKLLPDVVHAWRQIPDR